MNGFGQRVNGWIVVEEDGPCYESFARTKAEAIEQYVGYMKLWDWTCRDKWVKAVKVVLSSKRTTE